MKWNLSRVAELRRLQADRAQHDVQPFVAGERAAALAVAVEVEAAQLDRPQVLDVEGVVVLVDLVVGERHLGPDAALQQAVVVAVELLGDGDALRVEVLQRRPVALLLLDVAHVHLVDEAVLALGRHLGLGGVGLVGAHVVVLQRGQHRLHAGLDLGRVVAGAVAGQQELQHEGRARWCPS